MKHILIIFFLFFSYIVVAQQRFPTGVPTQFSTGWQKWGYQQSDSGTIIANRDTTWKAKYSGTIVFRPGDKRFYYFDSTILTWLPLAATAIDTTSLSNRINLKLNISDTAVMLLPYLRKADTANKWVQDVYTRNDSLFKQKNGSESFIHIFNTSGTGTVTSVGLSMPSAFSVIGTNPITSSGTFNIIGAGTTFQYIRGNGTLATTDTGMIPNFYIKARSLLSGTSPITYNSFTGAIGIPNADELGTKGASTYSNSDFQSNGLGLISLRDVVSSGSCTNCNITYDSKGRITFASNGSGGGGGNPNSNVGVGYRWAVPFTNNIKTANPGYGLLYDSTTLTNTITSAVDTNLIATLYRLKHAPIVDTFIRQWPINGIDYSEQPATIQPYMWEFMASNPLSQWYDGVSASTVVDTLIVFGGWNAGVDIDSVFQSVNGGQTLTFRSNLPYAVHTPAVIRAHDGYTYIIGGDYLTTSADRAKVYRTKDFKTYELRTASSPFGSRVLHGAFELNGTLYCGGGQYYTLNRTDTLFTDLYKSEDGGITWNLISDTLTFLGKNISGTFTVSSGIVRQISGGIYDNTEGNKTFDKTTYWSKDAIHWYRGSDLPLYSGLQYPNVFSWDGKTWIAGGYSGLVHDNIDSTIYMDKSGIWHYYIPPVKPTANHAAATIVINDIAYRILGNTTNQIWRIRRDTANVYYEATKYFFRTKVAFDTLGRNKDGYNIDAVSQTGINEDRYTNSAAVNRETWEADDKRLYNNNVLTWEFPASGFFRAKTLRAYVSNSSYLGAAFFNPMVQAQANFPAFSMEAAAHTFLLGVDGDLFKFRQEDGTTGNRFAFDITNGHTAIAGNSTNGYDISTVAAAVLALKSTNSGFIPPVMTDAQRAAITVGRIGSVTISNAGSGYTNGSYAAVSLTGGSGTGAAANITVSGGVVSNVVITVIGSNYHQGDILSANSSDIGGTGSGLQITITIQETSLMVFDTDSSRVSVCNGATWKYVAWTTDITGGAGGITSINSQSGPAITLAVGTTGTDFAATTTSNTVTFNLPDAGTSARGVVTTGSQTFTGQKTFNLGAVITMPTSSSGPYLSISGNRSVAAAPGISGTLLAIPSMTYTNSSGAGTETNGQNFNLIGAPTLTSSSAISYTGDVSTLRITGSPIASGSTTISHPYSLYAVNTSLLQTVAFGLNEQSTSTTLGDGSNVIYTGAGGDTFTLPSLATHPGKTYLIKNASSGNLTVTRSGSDNIYDTSSVTSITIAAGASRILVAGSSFWYAEMN